MKKKLLIGLLASLMVFSFAAACGETDKPDNSTSNSTSNSTDNSTDNSSGDSSGDEVSKYTLTLRNGNPRDASVETLELEAGAALDLPTLTAEGKTFKGWFSMDENNAPTVAAPAVMPEEMLVLYAVWEVTPYTLTIVNGDVTTEVKFGVEYDFENGIELCLTDLAYYLEDNLPEGTEDAAYVWAEEIPEVFALQNYTFTVNAVEPVTLILAGDRYDETTYEYKYLAAGAALDLPFLTAEGKIFAGWVYYEEVYNEEYDWYDEVAKEAPAVMPEGGLLLEATWEIIPYTINITLPNGEVVTVQIGADSVYNEDYECIVYDYTNASSVSYAIETALLACATETVIYVVELPTNAETGEVELALQDYEFTATEADRVFTVYLNRGESRTYTYGETIELPTPDPIEGATFVKWVYYYYNEETFEMEQLDVPATASSAIDGVSFQQLWDVEKYTVTLHNVEIDYVYNEETEEWEPVIGDMVINFGAMIDSENDIYATPADLAWTLESYLPESTDKVSYAWDKALPTDEEGNVAFGLENYEFTVVATTTLSISEALAIGAGKAHNNYTSEKYYVNGTIVNISNDYYGNVTIADAEGNTIYVYGTHDQSGEKYNVLGTNNVNVGDVIKYYSVVGNYNGAQLKEAVLMESSTPETTADIHKVIIESFGLTLLNKVTEAGSSNLPTATKYTDIAIAWASSNTEVAAIADGAVTFTLPAEDTNVTITATLTLGEVTYTKEFTVSVAAAPAANEKVVAVTFGTDDLKGTQYADETYVINEDLTISSHNNGCWFDAQLRIYDSESNDGWVILTCSGAASKLEFNMGYKKADLLVYGSTDGVTWEAVGTITTTSTGYLDYSLDVDETKGYTYLKLDASGAQLRIKSLTVTMLG